MDPSSSQAPATAPNPTEDTCNSAPATGAEGPNSKVFLEIEKELEIIQYATNKSGKKVKRVPKNQLKARSDKRKALMMEDMEEMAIEADEDEYSSGGDGGNNETGDDGGDGCNDGNGVGDEARGDIGKDRGETKTSSKRKRKRLRGSMVAFEDVVLNDMPFAPPPKLPGASVDENSDKKNGNPTEKNSLDSPEKNNESPMETNINVKEHGGFDADNYKGPSEDLMFNEDDDIFQVLDSEAKKFDMACSGGDVEGDNDDAESGDDEEEGEDLDEDVDVDENDEDEDEANENQTERNPKSESSQSQHLQRDNPLSSETKPKKKPRGSANNRIIHRIRAFSSAKLAQQHGEAMGAHARGMSDLAIKKLREIAKAAPGAPQIYSSLGLVYESMLNDVEKRIDEMKQENKYLEPEHSISFLELIQRQMELAQKAYGSYHVAALLCKRDFVLWERSGDMAMRIKEILSDVIAYRARNPDIESNAGAADESDDVNPADEKEKSKGFDPLADPDKLRSDKKFWTDHAFAAYLSADNLRPPGVDIPCKLARIHMEFGSYADALSILTDLKNKSRGKTTISKKSMERPKRSEMEESFPCWLLYADLMMKIGYECTKWNEGICINQNYMFRRWLKQNSKTFDWKERRLQALCLALEAAAGSVACGKLTEWMKNRAESGVEGAETDAPDASRKSGEDCNDTTPKDKVDISQNEVSNGNSNNKPVSDSTSDNTLEKKAIEEGGFQEAEQMSHEQERTKLISLNSVEMQKFDLATKEMNLVEGSHMHRNRMSARAELLQKHRSAIVDLAKRFTTTQEKTQNPSSLQCSLDEKLPRRKEESSLTPLPAQASCATVFDIATSLTKLCIHLSLYDGGVLVIEAVLLYFRERLSRYERKIERRRNFESRQKTGKELDQSFLSASQMSFDSDSEDGESDVYISDDEELEHSSSSPGLLLSLKSGVLPIELKALYSLCLVGAGGQDFLALNHLENVILSSELDSFDTENNAELDSNADDTDWTTFQRDFASDVSKTSLLALITDMVKVEVKSKVWVSRVSRIFQTHLKRIDNDEGLDNIFSGSNELVRNSTLKILYAATKMLLAKVDLDSTRDAARIEEQTIESVTTAAIHALKILTRFQYVMWVPLLSDWSLPPKSINMIKILFRAISMLACIETTSPMQDSTLPVSIKEAFSKSRYVISIICNAEDEASKHLTSIGDEDSPGLWSCFPLSSDWQNSFHKKLSLRAYNLCVSCCVSSFSGWEKHEFNLDLLRNHNADVNLFGITLSGPCVVGYLSDGVASSISDQWQTIQSMLPNLEALRFDALLKNRQDVEWYQNFKKNLKKHDSGQKDIALFAEDFGIMTMLNFSKFCLFLAGHSKGTERDDMIKLSMSIILPMTQFGIDKKVWESKIGTAGITESQESKAGYYLDENSQWMGPTNAASDRPQPPPRKRQQPQPLKILKMKRKDPSIDSSINVSSSVLLAEWRKDGPEKHQSASEDAKLAMKNLDDAMTNLRKSRTLYSLERSSLDVSVALINVASFEECYNPFQSLQQAAIYAALGPKRGNFDEPFRKFLPLEKKCSSSEAIVILGRADCLRAIYFIDEAQFLCSWVAKVCHRHRDTQEKDLFWDSRWKVVGVLVYVVATTIDETIMSLDESDKKKWVLTDWEENVVDEILLGKADARSLIDLKSREIADSESIFFDGEDLLDACGIDSSFIDANKEGEDNHFNAPRKYNEDNLNSFLNDQCDAITEEDNIGRNYLSQESPSLDRDFEGDNSYSGPNKFEGGDVNSFLNAQCDAIMEGDKIEHKKTSQNEPTINRENGEANSVNEAKKVDGDKGDSLFNGQGDATVGKDNIVHNKSSLNAREDQVGFGNKLLKFSLNNETMPSHEYCDDDIDNQDDIESIDSDDPFAGFSQVASI